MKIIVFATLAFLSGCTSISMMSNGISSKGRYVFLNTNKMGENKLLIQFLGDKLLVKNMKDESDINISEGDSDVYSVNSYMVGSGRISFRVRATEPCQAALVNNKHPFFIAAQTDRENRQYCSIRYIADIKTAKKVQ